MSNHSKYPKEAGIYKLTSNDSGKIYIGKAVNLRKRLNVHKNCKKVPNGMFHFQNALVKYGWDSFTVEILEVFEDFVKLRDNASLLQREAYYIEFFDATNSDKGYNLCKFSTDTTGIPLSEEHKDKIRQAHLGKTMPIETKEKLIQSNLGRVVSDKTREKLRQSKIGKPFSDEHKEKLRQSRLGKKMTEENKKKLLQCRLGKPRSEETKEKLRQAHLGKTLSEEHKEKIRQSKLKTKLIKTEIQ
jgi:group I intron endonuclease